MKGKVQRKMEHLIRGWQHRTLVRVLLQNDKLPTETRQSQDQRTTLNYRIANLLELKMVDFDCSSFLVVSI